MTGWGAFTTNLSSPKAIVIKLEAIVAMQDDRQETLVYLAGVANPVSVIGGLSAIGEQIDDLQ